MFTSAEASTEFLIRFLVCLSFIAVGAGAIVMLYRKKEFPRRSRLLWGFLFVGLAVVNTLTLEQLSHNIDEWFKVSPWDFSYTTIRIRVIAEMLSRLIPFVFGAVGAGLISNSLINRQ